MRSQDAESGTAAAEVVENAAPAWRAEDAWRIEARPLVSIGRVDGPAEYQLFRVIRALRLSDSTIVVANGGTSEVRFYDRTGSHVRTVGGRGAGPGEFGALPFLRRFGGDSLIAWDGRNQRGTVLGPDGGYVRNIGRPDIGGDFIYYADAFADGSLLGVASGYRAGRLPDSSVQEEARFVSFQVEPQGLLHDTALLFRMRPSGTIDRLGAFFHGESYKVGQTMISMPFGHRAALAVTGDHVHYGSGHSFEIRTYSSRGQLERVVRYARANPPLTRSMIDAFIERTLSRMRDPSQRNSMRLLYNAVEYPDVLPAFSDLLVDAAGNLWTAGFHHWLEAQPSWTVFDSRGRLLGELEAPPGLTIHEIGEDYVLGRAVDEFDVERVVLHRLLKPGAPR